VQYQSSRGNSPSVTAAQAIINGIAPDGGLYIPDKIPSLSKEDFINWIDLPYQGRAQTVLQQYLTDFSPAKVSDCIKAAYNQRNFDNAQIAPLIELSPRLHMLELWHGPTSAFKDMALQILPHLLTTSMKKTGENNQIVILVATSGDTGKAALEGFRDVAGTQIVVFYPAQGVSQVQRLQMVTQAGENVNVAGVTGNFDDAQNGVKKIFGDQDFIGRLAGNNLKMSSANSINWGRLLPQIVYYLSAYADLLREGRIEYGEAVNIVVPTGNFGNILAAFYARQMGLPVGRLICAANANNILTDFINSGVYDRNRPFYKTISPSMDILISSNLERLLAEVSGHDFQQVNAWMKQLSAAGRYEVSGLVRDKIQELFWSDFGDDRQTIATIRKTWDTYQYLADTHTAVALCVYDRYREKTGDNRTTIIASTASPFKFGSSVAEAILPEAIRAGKDEFSLIRFLSEWTGSEVPQGIRDLDKRPVLHDTTTSPADMQNTVARFLKL
jgi:threonine synthase